MAAIKINPYARIVPMIYAYTTPGVPAHDGWTKIGYTGRQTVEDRIRQQTHTVNVEARLEWKSEARYTDGSGTYFTDHDFHDYLTAKRQIARNAHTEWFQIVPNLAWEYFLKFREKDYSDLQGSAETGRAYTLRAEQKDAVEQTLAYYHSGATPREFLWNAKPRFGKTLTTYDFMRRIGAKNVLIVTNRPSIANSWYDDFAEFIGWQTSYKFISETDALAERPVLSRQEYLAYLDGLSEAEAEKTGQVAFESLQGLKGSLYFGGNYDKLRWIAGTKWDLLVIDEAHEGVDTYKTDKAFDQIDRTFTLHLSGTPFKAIASAKFRAEQIYNWSYADEQAAKADWAAEDGANPYEGLPRLSLFTYQLSKMIADKVQRGLELSEDEHAEYAFDLGEFFRTEKGKFVYEADVRKFLDALTTHAKFPFSTPELRAELAHTFWLLDRVDSAKAMVKLLAAHPVFKDYAVVLAAGDGRTDECADDAGAKRSLERVKEAIAAHDKTITLSVGQLTTGVTVKPWTAVLMLSNMKSPAEYMQAAFRAQNPYRYEKDGKLFEKTNAYIFDFAPERTLLIFDDFANSLNAQTAAGRGTKAGHAENIRRLLNFFPVIGEDKEGQMVELTAEEVLTIPKSIKAQEVIRRGFMSNFLFENIGNIFSAPAAVREVLKKLPREQQQADRKNPLSMDDAEAVSVDENGAVAVPNEIVVNKTGKIFGKKLYDTATDRAADILAQAGAQEAWTGVQRNPSAVEQANRQMAQQVAETLSPQLYQTAKQEYGLTSKQAAQIQKQVERKAQERFTHLSDDHEQEKKILTAEFLEKQQQTQSAEELAAVQGDYQQKIDSIAAAYMRELQQETQRLITESAQEVTRALETREEERKKKGVEDDIRAHLRGFTRTIPSFIMAYSEAAHGGSANLSLKTLDDYTPDEVFLEVTGISEEDFRFLRDGGERENPITHKMEHFAGGFFNEVVFDESIKEFLALKQRLNNYFDENAEEDIFDYIPPQKTNQIFTPRSVVARMADALEAENSGIFDDPDRTFVDFYMKSGLYITELVKRLYRSANIKAAYPDDHARLKHILEKQVFGFAPSPIIHSIAIAYIFGFDEQAKEISTANFVQADTAEAVKAGRLAELVENYFGNRIE